MPIPTFTKLGPNPQFHDLVNKINTIVAELINMMLNMDSLNVVSLTADHIDAGTLNAGVVTIRGEDGTVYYQIDSNGIVANNGTQNTLEFDLSTGLLTLVSMLLKSSDSNEKVVIDSTGFHSYDSSGIERLTIGTTPAQGAKALIGRDTSGNPQSVYTYDTENVDGGDKTGQFITGPDAQYLLFDDAGGIRLQETVTDRGVRILPSGRPELKDGGGWEDIATVTEVNAKATIGASTSSNGAQSLNGGIPVGTQLLDADGVTTWTWNGISFGAHSHTQT